MPRFNTEEQFKFLISCIRYSNNGRIDFVEVAKECGIISKGAAAKRYERMMRAHSIGVEFDADGNEMKAAPRRKRKRAQDATDAATVDDQAGTASGTGENASNVKKERKQSGEAAGVGGADEGTDEDAPLMKTINGHEKISAVPKIESQDSSVTDQGEHVVKPGERYMTSEGLWLYKPTRVVSSGSEGKGGFRKWLIG